MLLSETTFLGPETFLGDDSPTTGDLYYFTPPTRELTRAGSGRLFGRYTIAHGVTLLFNNGQVTERVTPTSEQLEAADYAFRGGYLYEITGDTAEYDLLVDAGYGDLLVAADSTEGGFFLSDATYLSPTTYLGAA